MAPAAAAAGLAFGVPAVAIAQDSAGGAAATVPAGREGTGPSPRAKEGRDHIYLRDGSILRGAILDITPGVEARIEVESGEVVSVSRLDTMRIEQATEPPPVPPTPRAGEANLPEMVWVHMDGPSGARIEQDLGYLQREWATVCTAPCTAQLPRVFKYRVAGAPGGPSWEFSLAASSGQHERIRTRAPSKAWFVLGLIGIGVGGVTAGYTLLALVTALELPCLMGGTCGSASGFDGGRAFGLVGGGVAVAVVGALTVRANSATAVLQDVTLPPVASSARKGRPEFEGPTTEMRHPPMVGLPILIGRF